MGSEMVEVRVVGVIWVNRKNGEPRRIVTF